MEENKYSSLNYAFIALGISLPLSLFFTNYLFVLAIIFLLFNSPKRKKVRWVTLLVLSMPALIPILSILFHDETFGLNNIDVKIPFLVVAITIGFVKINDTVLSKFKHGFVLGSILGAILAVFSKISFVIEFQSKLFIELTYVSLFIVISIIFLWFTDIEIKKYLKIALSSIFVVALFLLGEPFFIITGTLIVFAAIIIKGTLLQSKITIGVLVLLFSIFLYKGNEIQFQLKEADNKKEFNGVDKLAQWQCVLEVMKNRELLGVGYNSKEGLLITCYHEHDMIQAVKNNLNSHNEYLDTFLTLGYIGVLGLLIYFLNIFFVAYDTKQVAHLLIIILIALYSITENVFTRQKGVMIASITCLLIFSSKTSKQNEQTKESLLTS